MTGLVAGIGLRGVLAGAGAFFGRLPSWVPLALIGVAAAFIGLLVHHHEVKLTIAHAKQEQKQIDDAAWKQALAKEHQAALTWKAGFDKQTAATVADERKLNDQAIANNAAVARALSLHGPGRASASGCRSSDHSRPSTASGGHEQDSANTNVAGPQVPSGNGQDLSGYAIVPWGWLTQRAEQFDDMLSDLQRIEDNDKKQRANWPSR